MMKNDALLWFILGLSLVAMGYFFGVEMLKEPGAASGIFLLPFIVGALVCFVVAIVKALKKP